MYQAVPPFADKTALQRCRLALNPTLIGTAKTPAYLRKINGLQG
jgi:hypothetical protein